MALIITDFPKINKKVIWSTTSCGQKCNFCWKNSNKICNCQSHPYLMWKSSNIVLITLVYKIILCSIVIDIQFFFLSNTWKYNFLIDHHCETKSESSDSVTFVRIVWCSCRLNQSSENILVYNQNCVAVWITLNQL